MKEELNHRPNTSRTEMSCYRKEVKIIVFVSILVTFIHINYIFISHLRYYYSDEFIKRIRWYHYPTSCKLEGNVTQDMVNLTASAMQVFDELSIPAAACYGTLWGIVRGNFFLPWDTNVDFCALNDKVFKNVSFHQLQRALHMQGVGLHPFDWNSGSYRISKGKAIGEINVFYDCSTIVYLTHTEYGNDKPIDIPMSSLQKPRWVCPMGWGPSMAKFIHRLNKPFPAWLLESPFSKQSLNGVEVNVPQDGFEIQKYLYPDDWWLEAKPPGC